MMKVIEADLMSQAREFIEQNLPKAEVALFDQFYPTYKKLVDQNAGYLETEGRLFTRKALEKVLSQAQTSAIEQSKPKAPTQLERLIEPVKTPLIKGAKSEAIKVLTPFAVGAGVGLATALVLAFMLGRWSK